MFWNMTGFDIGDKTIKLAVYHNDKLKTTVSAELPAGLVYNGEITSMDDMADFIKNFAKTNKLHSKNAALILPMSKVYVRNITVPMMTERELTINLPYEFRDYLTKDSKEYYYDYEVLETIEDEEGNAKEQKIFACATEIETIDNYKKMFSKAGYSFKRAVPEEYVYSRISRGDTGMSAPENSVFAIADFGHQSLRVHILRDGQYDSKRVIDIGIRELDELIADDCGVGLEEAASYKLTNHNECLTSSRCMDFYNRLGIEIMKATNFYNYNNRSLELNDLYLCGGGAAIEPLCDVIAQVTGLSLHSAYEFTDSLAPIGDPWLHVRSIGVGAKE